MGDMTETNDENVSGRQGGGPVYSLLTEEGRAGCEMISGHMVSGMPEFGEWRKLCFMLGTLLEDHITAGRLNEKVIFGPCMLQFDEDNVFRCDLMTVYRGSGEAAFPRLAVNILTEKNALYECMDKTQSYKDCGAAEYWLIDLERQFVYVFSFGGGQRYRRCSFDQNIHSSCYSGFTCCISEMMWEEGGCLKEMAVFYRFRKEMGLDPVRRAVSEPFSGYDAGAGEAYTAEAFYEWIKTRRNLPEFSQMTELLLGGIRAGVTPDFRHQFIQGNLYFAIKTYLRAHGCGWQICFSPMAAELSRDGILDSVVRPDIFLVPEQETLPDSIYRGVPLWIIEIADPSSAARDYIDKEQIYQYHAVREYWIINDWKRQVMTVRYGADGAGEEPDDISAEAAERKNADISIHSYKDNIEVKCLPGLVLSMQDVLEL